MHRSADAYNQAVTWTISTRDFAVLLVCALPATAIDQAPNHWAPNEAEGLEQIVKALPTAFDYVDVLELGEGGHQRKVDSDLRIALVRSPEFARRAHFIVVEFASTAEQEILDRYIRGDDVPIDELQRVWRNTTQSWSSVWESPVYAEFFAAVRDVNRTLPPAGRIRVLGGDPPEGSSMDRNDSAVAVLEKDVLKHHAKALVIYGSGHLQRTGGITWKLEHARSRVRVFAVCSLGGPQPYFKNFEIALPSDARPILLSATRPPLRDLVDSRPFNQFFDACIYWGMAPAVERVVPPGAASDKR